MGNRITAEIVNCLTYPCFSAFCQNPCRKKPPRSVVLLVVGLDNAGKSAIVNYLFNKSLLSMENVVPTIGFRTVIFKHKSFTIRIYDVGGGPQIRALWPKYYDDVHGVIYVVDANDIERLPESANLFQELACHELISQKPILFLGNKQDLDDAVDELDLIKCMNIENIVNFAKCFTRVEICSCYPDNNKNFNLNKNIDKGFEWLLNVIDLNYKDLKKSNDRVKSKEKVQRSFRLKSWEARLSKNSYDCQDTDSDSYLKPIVPTIENKHRKYRAEKNTQVSSRKTQKILFNPQKDMGNTGKRKKKRCLTSVCCIPNNRTAPLTNNTNGESNIPTVETMKELIRNIKIEDLIINPESGENATSEYRRPRRKRKRRPNTAPADMSKPETILLQSPESVSQT